MLSHKFFLKKQKRKTYQVLSILHYSCILTIPSIPRYPVMEYIPILPQQWHFSSFNKSLPSLASLSSSKKEKKNLPSPSGHNNPLSLRIRGSVSVCGSEGRQGDGRTRRAGNKNWYLVFWQVSLCSGGNWPAYLVDFGLLGLCIWCSFVHLATLGHQGLSRPYLSLYISLGGS